MNAELRRMAEEAGIDLVDGQFGEVWIEQLEAFAKLVAEDAAKSIRDHEQRGRMQCIHGTGIYFDDAIRVIRARYSLDSREG